MPRNLSNVFDITPILAVQKNRGENRVFSVDLVLKFDDGSIQEKTVVVYDQQTEEGAKAAAREIALEQVEITISEINELKE